jgi:glycosyltransferase involved in cell wall biosynthesis
MFTQPTFSVFTATFNRAKFLPKLYEALLNQTFKSFEWLIIDDGSSDNTQKIIENFVEENKISIKYIYQEHKGKHAATNKALDLANGIFFLPLDDDDLPLNNALSLLISTYEDIPEVVKPYFSAVTGLCIDPEGKVIGDAFPEDIIDSDPIEMYYKFKIKGDKWGCQLTKIRKQYKYPVPSMKLNYYPEITIFGEIAKKYKTRYINKPLKIVRYHSDGLSKRKLPNAYSKKISHMYILNEHIDYFEKNPYEFFIHSILYTRWSLHCKKIEIKGIKPILSKILILVSFPAGFLFYLYDKFYAQKKI